MRTTIRTIAALLAASVVISAWDIASAAPYNLVGYYRRSAVGGAGVLNSAMFKAGAAQGCPGPTYIQPCYDPAQPWTSSNGVDTAVTTAGPPTWDWNGTTLTETGLLWATWFIFSNPSNPSPGASFYSDRVENLTINTGTSSTNATTYSCIEGNFYASVGLSACKFSFTGFDFVDDSTVAYNVGSNSKCVTMTIGNDDYSRLDGSPGVPGTPQPRGLTAQTAGQAGAGCAQTSGAFDMHVILDDGTYLILANATYPGTCLIFGLTATSPCPEDRAFIGASFLVLAAPGAPDADSDGIPNGLDNCPSTANPDQLDSDGDGLNTATGSINPTPGGDACDTDKDNDGIADGSDNCPLIANWNQANVDGDAFGNVCDSDIDGDGTVNGVDPDDDGDTIPDSLDNCQSTANTNQANADGDALGDACDNCTAIANTEDPFTVFVSGTVIPRYQLDSDHDGYGNRCDADLNNSATVTTGDFSLLRGVLNEAHTQSANSARADLNASGTVTTGDFTLLRNALNGTPGPSGLH